jgi:hypothetical protein
MREKLQIDIAKSLQNSFIWGCLEIRYHSDKFLTELKKKSSFRMLYRERNYIYTLNQKNNIKLPELLSLKCKTYNTSLSGVCYRV